MRTEYLWVDSIYNYADPQNPIKRVLRTSNIVTWDYKSWDISRFNLVKNILYDVDGRSTIFFHLEQVNYYYFYAAIGGVNPSSFIWHSLGLSNNKIEYRQYYAFMPPSAHPDSVPEEEIPLNITQITIKEEFFSNYYCLLVFSQIGGLVTFVAVMLRL